MAQKSPWSVKGIDDRAREQAREKARAEGLTLGQYLNKLILEGAASPDDEDWLDELEGIEPANTDRTPQAEALHALTRRIEASEARSTLAITGIDQSVAGLVARIDQLQKGSNAVSMRIDGTTEEIKATQDALRERLTRLEGDDSNTRNVEALKSLESALGRLATQVYDDTAKTESRQQALEQKLEEELFDVSSKVTALDERVDTTLTEAARKIEDAVRDAELRTEGSVKHLSERVGGIETTVADRLGRSDQQMATMRSDMGGLRDDVAGAISSVGSTVSRLNERFDASEERNVNALNTISLLENDLVDTKEDMSSSLKNIEATIARVSDRLSSAEATTDKALQTLEQSFDSLDKRLNDIDPEAGELLRQEMDDRFNRLASDLAESVQQTRNEIADEIERAAGAVHVEAFDEITQTIVEMNKRLRATESRQTNALEAIGEEVTRASLVLDKRLQRVEGRNEDGNMDLVRDQIRSLTTRFEQRLDAIEDRETGAIEKVGKEVGDLASKLDDRIGESERRSAQAIEQVGEQVAQVTGRMQARQDASLKQLSQEIAEQEKRSQARIDAALGDVRQQITSVETSANAALSPIQKAMASLAERLDAVEDFSTPPGSPQRRNPSDTTFEIPTITAGATTAAVTPEPAASATTGGSDRFNIPDEDDIPLTTSGDAWDKDFSEDSFDTPDFAVNDELPGSEPDFLADLPDDDINAPPVDDFDDAFAEANGFNASPMADEGDYISRARRAASSASSPNGRDQTVAGFNATGKGSGSKIPALAAAGAVALAVAGAGGYMMMRGTQEAPSPRVSDQPDLGGIIMADEPEMADPTSANPVADLIPEDDDGAGGITIEISEEPLDKVALVAPPVRKPEERAITLASATPVRDDAPRRAAAPALPRAETIRSAPVQRPSRPAPTPTATPVTQPTPITAAPSITRPEPTRSSPAPAAPAPTRAAAPQAVTMEGAAAGGNGIAQYELGVKKIAEGDLTLAASLIQKAARQDVAVAQYRLAKMYERGQGVARDLNQARVWTQRAAEAGNVKAMHDLAVFMAEGEGGPQSFAAAVDWFQRAAAHGLTDSQYNLGVLYEQGLGVTTNAAEALYWFEVAARLGDPGAPEKVRELGQRLGADQAASVQARAALFQATPTNGKANGRFGPRPWA